MSEPVFLSLGSNLGDRRGFIEETVTAICALPGIGNPRRAALYESEPLYNRHQPAFLNTVLGLESDRSPADWLNYLQGLEQAAGRPAERGKNQPRTLDIDILAIGRRVVDSPRLRLPHPDLNRRKFVLLPWAEIAPDFIVPVWETSVRELLVVCGDRSRVVQYQTESAA